MAWDHEHEAVLEYYDRVIDTGDFERQLCPRALAGLRRGAIARELRIKLPEIGVGYALYALLPIIDHVSAMCKGESERTQRDYAPLRGATLRRIQCLLQPP